MQQVDQSAAAHTLLRRLAMVIAIAAGLLVLINPMCRTDMSMASVTSTSTGAVVAAHRSVPSGDCGDMVGPGDRSCRGGAATSTARADQSSTAAQAFAAGPSLPALRNFAESSTTPIAGTPTDSLPAPGTSMLACIAVLMMVLAAISRLRVHRSTAGAPANLPLPLLLARCARRATLAELCVLRT